jgi:hypothetical protein
VVSLTDQEARDLVYTILEAVEHVEEGTELRDSWPAKARDWCLLILDRLEGNQ